MVLVFIKDMMNIKIQAIPRGLFLPKKDNIINDTINILYNIIIS